jgi:hypothetical protein
MSASIRHVGVDSPVSSRDILLAIAQWIIAQDLWGRAVTKPSQNTNYLDWMLSQ